MSEKNNDRHRYFDCSKKKHFDLLFVGDTSHGENYQNRLKAEDNILKTRGYRYSFKRMKRIMEESDLVVCNLETPITDLPNSPFEGQKRYVHWTDPVKAPEVLKQCNVGLIGLANNHSYDYGEEGFKQTQEILSAHQIPYIGGGGCLEEALTPYIGEILFKRRRLTFSIFSAFSEVESYRKRYGCYATEDSPGISPLNPNLLLSNLAKIKRQYPDHFSILFVHWGDNYRWKSEEQQQLARELIHGGFDLIIGHGAHRIQEFERIGDKWVVYSIGNFIFNSRGRYAKENSPPYSAVVRLRISDEPDRLAMKMRLYPIVTNNLITHYCTRFVSDREFNAFNSVMEQQLGPSDSELPSVLRGRDGYGLHWELPLTSLTRSREVSESHYVGMICHVRWLKPLKEQIAMWMFRAIAIDKELVRQGYRLLCYTPADLDPINGTVKGYLYENGEFQPVTARVPRVNYDWHIGSIDMGKRNGLGLTAFFDWADQRGVEIYPGPSLRSIANEKYTTYSVIHKSAPELVPYSESFNKNKKQIEQFFQKWQRLFIKPTRGNMGNDIWVIHQQNVGYGINFYRKKVCRHWECQTIEECLNIWEMEHEKGDYIIQRAVDTLKYRGSPLNLRIVRVDDGKRWHSIGQIWAGPAGSDLAHLSQQGELYLPEEIFKEILGEEGAKKLLEKVEKAAQTLTEICIQNTSDEFNEFAIDFLIDNELNLYVAELNAKPGLAGTPEFFEDFFHMTEREAYIYTHYTLPHGRSIAKFLIHKAKQLEPIEEAVDLHTAEREWASSEELAKELANNALKALKGEKIALFTASEEKAPCVLILTVSNGSSEGRSVTVGASSPDKALHRALQQLNSLLPADEIRGVKVDLLYEIIPLGEYQIDEMVPIERSLEGIAFGDDLESIILPEELTARNLIGRDGSIRQKKLSRWERFSDATREFFTTAKSVTPYKLRFNSAFADAQETYSLFRGHRLWGMNEIDDERLEASIRSAAHYLTRCVQEDGRFDYLYLPKTDRTKDDYNILRHAGTIYAMLEAYERIGGEELLQASQRALGYLKRSTIARKIGETETLCIVENGMIKLGANALTVLAISQLAQVVSDPSFLELARGCARWIALTQDAMGNFLIHKQAVESGAVSKFTSGYYPGEAIYALAQLYRLDKQIEWLKVAQKAAEYIIEIRDREMDEENLAHDHWLLYGLELCDRMEPDERFANHTEKICRAIIDAQKIQDVPIDAVGSFYSDARSTPAATRAEGLAAAYQLLLRYGRHAFAKEVLNALERSLLFQLQTQFDAAAVIHLPNPGRALGGFHCGLTDYTIRIDYVQHNLSALLGYLRCRKGALSYECL